MDGEQGLYPQRKKLKMKETFLFLKHPYFHKTNNFALFQANETPLHMASKVKGSEKVVDVLIKSGADPDAAKQVIDSKQ